MARSKSIGNARDLAAEIAALAKSLQDNEDLEVEWEAGGPASAEDLERAKKLGLSDDFLATWAAMDGCSCKWHDISEGAFEESRGGFEFSPLADIVREDREGRIFFDSDPEDDLKRSFYPVESYDPFGSGNSCGVVMNGSSPIKIHFLSGEPELFPLKVDLAGYVDLLRQTRGYLYWPAAIANAINDDTSELETMFEDLERMFPELQTTKVQVPS